MTEILVIDDDLGPFKPGLQHALRGYVLHLAYSGEEGLALLEREPRIACVLLDILMPAHFAPDDHREGIEVLKRIKQRRPDVPVVMLTVLKDVDLVVEAMKEGAFHYITKPIDRDKLRDAVARAVENVELKDRLGSLTRARDAMLKVHSGAAKPRDRFQEMIGGHPLMQELYGKIERAAQFDDMNVVVLGETGSGKDLAAKAIHQCSPRAKGPYVAVNCSAIAESVLEAELFGHEKGAFTGADAARDGLFARADGGTLFLDEIGDMPLALQVKLLRAIENKEITPVGGKPKHIDVRIVCATHRDLAVLKDAGQFRDDLYFRIWHIPITLPPLRQRRDDIPLLVRHFLDECGRNGRIPCVVDLDAMGLLTQYDWPGNVRDLYSTVRRLTVFAEDGRITRSLVQSQLCLSVPGPDTAKPVPSGVTPDAPAHGSGDEGVSSDACQSASQHVQPESEHEIPDDGYPEILDITEYRRIHGEIKLKQVIERAVREGGSARAAMALLGMPEERYDMFRKWLQRLNIRVRGFV